MELKFDSVRIDLGSRTYPIIIGEDLLGVVDKFVPQDIGRSALIVTNHTVGGIYLDELRSSLDNIFDCVYDAILPDGE